MFYSEINKLYEKILLEIPTSTSPWWAGGNRYTVYIWLTEEVLSTYNF